MKKLSVITVLLLLFLSSCVKKELAPTEQLLGLDYYPLASGKFVIYDIDSVVFTEIPRDTITYKYRIKEKLADTYTDNEGQTAWRIERFIKKFDPKRSYDSIPWSVKEVWMLNADNRSVRMLESNIRYTKLVFPVEQNSSWNGNAYNTQGERIYSYSYIDNTESINKTQLNNVLLVKQLEYTTLISDQHYFEKYAKDIGLVSKEITDIYSNNIVAGKPVADRIEKGLVYKQTYVTHGYE